MLELRYKQQLQLAYTTSQRVKLPTLRSTNWKRFRGVDYGDVTPGCTQLSKSKRRINVIKLKIPNAFGPENETSES